MPADIDTALVQDPLTIAVHDAGERAYLALTAYEPLDDGGPDYRDHMLMADRVVDAALEPWGGLRKTLDTIATLTARIAELEGERNVPVPVYKRVEAILDEHSAWIARPNHAVTEKIALAATFAAHAVMDASDRDWSALEARASAAEAQVAERDAEIARLREAAEIGRDAIHAAIEEVEQAQPGAFGTDSMGDGTVPGGLMTWDRSKEILHYLRQDEERIRAALAGTHEEEGDAGREEAPRLRAAAQAALDYLTLAYNEGWVEGQGSGEVISDLHAALMRDAAQSGTEGKGERG